MNTDIRLSTDFPAHPKVLRLIGLAGYEAAHRLICLWVWASQNRADHGDLSGVADEQIERFIGWTGPPGALMAAMADCRLLDRGPGHRIIHDWTYHNAFAAHAYDRKNAAKIANSVRWEQHRNVQRDAKTIRVGSKPDDPPSPSPSPSPKEEKNPPTPHAARGGDDPPSATTGAPTPSLRRLRRGSADGRTGIAQEPGQDQCSNRHLPSQGDRPAILDGYCQECLNYRASKFPVEHPEPPGDDLAIDFPDVPTRETV